MIDSECNKPADQAEENELRQKREQHTVDIR